MRKHFHVMAAVIVLALFNPPPASAEHRQFTNQSQFESATKDRDVATVESSPAGYYGNSGFIDLGTISVITSSPLFVQDTNYYGSGKFLSAQQESPIYLTFTADRLVTAFGFNYTSADPLLFYVDSFNLRAEPSPSPTSSFFGFTSDAPFSTVFLGINGDGIDLDNIQVADMVPPVPEPSSWALMGLGVFGAWFAARKRRGAAPGARALAT